MPDASTTTPLRERRRTTTGHGAVPDKAFEQHRSSGRLGYLLAWGVVFADIGTSIYYVPGLLFGELGGKSPSPAAAFVLATGLVFILLALKYVEVAARYPDGGGVVSVASDAFGPMIGCLGGILICVDYFLTGAISSVTGFDYLAGAVHQIEPWLVPCSCTAILLLGVLNVVGIRESAVLTVVLAVASFVVNVFVLGTVALKLDRGQWQLVMAQFDAVRALDPKPILTGFASSWLAFSGLESISQIAPALRDPRDRTALKAMLLVVAAILLTSPLMTAFETALLQAGQVKPERFLFELGSHFGSAPLQIAIVMTSSALLMGAANTAIIGCYHVFLALVRLGFMPAWLSERSRRFNTPHRAIAVSVAVPVAVILASRGQMALLGDMYAFGLLGAFSLTSVGLDRIRWQEHKRSIGFVLGVLTSVLIVGSWLINLVHKELATAFGGSVTAVGFVVALGVRRGWIGGAKTGYTTAEAAERAATQLPSAVEILTVEEALDMRAVYQSSTLVAMRSPNLRLYKEAVARVHGSDEGAVYLLFVDEVPGLFFPPKTGPSREAREILAEAAEYFRAVGVVAIPVWRMAHDAGASIAGAARRLGVSAVLVGTSHRSAVWHLLRGNVLRSLVRDLPEQTRVWICN
jgi:amino acid transporter/nucleotide-binding universal stress UspA family protein